MNKKVLFVCALASFILVGCTKPQVTQMSPLVDVDDEIKIKIEEREALSNELSGLSRKGEILDKIHEYQPFVKVLNVYIPGKQLDNGVYEHSRIESVPLVFKNSAIQLSPDSVERAFEDIKSTATPPRGIAPTNSIQRTNALQMYTSTERQSRRSAEEQREFEKGSENSRAVGKNEIIIHKGENQVRASGPNTRVSISE